MGKQESAAQEVRAKPFSDIFRESLEEQFASLSEASEKTGVSLSVLTRYKNGTRSLRLDTVEKVWPHLGIRLEPPSFAETVRTQGLQKAVIEMVQSLALPDLELARRCGLNQPTLWRFLHGKNVIKLEAMSKLWAVLPIRAYRGKRRIDLIQ